MSKSGFSVCASSSTAFSWWTVTKQAASDWSEDKATKLAAALAFYTMLSVGPLLIFSLKIVSAFLHDKPAQQVQDYVSSMVGSKAAAAVAEMITNQPKDAGTLATIVSVVVLLFSASGVFGELQDSLNTIWEVKPKPNQGILATIRQRFFSFTLVLGVAFLLLVSLVVSTVLSGLANYVGGSGIFWQAVNQIVSLGVVTALFALIFRYLPDVRNGWRSVWVGAILTAVLFTIGKYLLGLYLGRGSTTSVYGAAGSLVALLLWVYYAAQILFFGAEFTQAYARAVGEEAPPMKHAVYITEEDRAQRGIPSPQRVARKVAEAERPAPRPKIVRIPAPHPNGGSARRSRSPAQVWSSAPSQVSSARLTPRTPPVAAPRPRRSTGESAPSSHSSVGPRGSRVTSIISTSATGSTALRPNPSRDDDASRRTHKTTEVAGAIGRIRRGRVTVVRNVRVHSR